MVLRSKSYTHRLRIFAEEILERKKQTYRSENPYCVTIFGLYSFFIMNPGCIG
jgi:hypothetical protein